MRLDVWAILLFFHGLAASDQPDVMPNGLRNRRVEAKSAVRASNVFDDLQDICGRRGRNSNLRMTGGTWANPHEFPWQVFIAEKDYSPEILTSSCSGTLITDKWVLTHKDCPQFGFKAASFYAFMGAHNLSLTSEDHRISRLIEPTDEWVSGGLKLVKLKEPVIFDDYILPICLPWDTTGPYDYKNATLTGWGTWNETYSEKVLRKASTTIIPNSLCWALYGNVINDSVMCTSGFDGVGPCGNIDRGMPLSLGSNIFTQIGVQYDTPYSDGCRRRQPHVFTRIEPHLDWISSVVNSSAESHPLSFLLLVLFSSLYLLY